MSDYSFTFTLLFCAVLVLGLLVRFYLASRQIRHVAAHRGAVPAAFAATISLDAHQKAADYTVTKARFGLLEMAFGAALLLCWTLLSGIDVLNRAIAASGLAAYGSLVPQLALLAERINGRLDQRLLVVGEVGKKLRRGGRGHVCENFVSGIHEGRGA